jgi:hypothetical protein
MDNTLAQLPPPGNVPNRNEIYNPVLGGLNDVGGATGVGFFAALIPALIGLLMAVGAIVFIFMLLWGAVQWILSGGDKGAVESAKGRVTNAIVGLVLLFSTFAIVKLVETFFGINILTIDIGPLVIQ